MGTTLWWGNMRCTAKSYRLCLIASTFTLWIWFYKLSTCLVVKMLTVSLFWILCRFWLSFFHSSPVYDFVLYAFWWVSGFKVMLLWSTHCWSTLQREIHFSPSLIVLNLLAFLCSAWTRLKAFYFIWGEFFTVILGKVADPVNCRI